MEAPFNYIKGVKLVIFGTLLSLVSFQISYALSPCIEGPIYKINEIKNSNDLPKGIKLIYDNDKTLLVNESGNALYIIDYEYKKNTWKSEDFLKYSELPNGLVSTDKILNSMYFTKTNVYNGDIIPRWRSQDMSGAPLYSFINRLSYDPYKELSEGELPEPVNFSIDIYDKGISTLEFTAYFELITPRQTCSDYKAPIQKKIQSNFFQKILIFIGRLFIK